MQRDHAQRRLFEVLGAAGQVARHDDAEIAVCGIECSVDNAAVGHAAGEHHAADAKVAQQLAEAAPLRLIYVSCNPATLARDVARLAPAFRLKAARPVDLFPQTPHVEAVALLERA